MQYVLKNKDKEIMRFSVESVKQIERGVEFFTKEIRNVSVLNEVLLPINIDINDLPMSLESFIKHRKAPNNRENVKNLIATYNENKTEQLMDYIDVSLGLSLNDSYWIVPSSKDYKWKDYNLYQNAFNEILERVAFGIGNTHIKGVTSSPEFTTNGMLKKCWHKEEQHIYLYKGSSTQSTDGREYGGKEAYAEYYMSQIAEVMEFDYVPYDLKMFHNQLVSSCPIFTNENEGFVPMYYLLRDNDRKLKGLNLLKALREVYNDEVKLGDMLLFDSLIYNIDRHLGNFGMIVDNDTGEILRPAPIFDNGYSMMNLLYKDDLDNVALTLNYSQSYLELNFDLQMKLFVESRHTTNLQKLTTFTFKRHEQYNLSNEWLESTEQCIQQRAKKALEFIEEKTLNRNMQQEQDSTPQTHKVKRRR
ncbi:transcriptional regulator [Helicobacter labetoulli]|uniref:transcriptional regulator n=1 Tax=Helicobacter labetoulli TaxID=2315333 RepID=UPI000EF6A8CF|nr:transcriptional regulator [Helicobacter labetoulli]